MVNDYMVLTAAHPLDLASKVRDAIERGWIPQGGLSYSEPQSIWAQAIVKLED